MIEKFEERRLTGPVNVVCKFDDGSRRIWQTRKETVVEQVTEIMNIYDAQGYTLTLRQLHYQFVSRNWIVNHTSAYKRLGEILQDCRWSGSVDWDGIEDRGRVPVLPYWVHDIPDALRDTLSSYRLDLQKDQETHIELWTEKDALSGILGRPAEKYHVRLCVNKGYTSDSAIYGAYERFVPKLNEYKKVKILYFGDHDPSGLDMIRDIESRIRKMIENGDQVHSQDSAEFDIIPIGLTMEQIKKYKLPPNPAKTTDSRAAAYIKKFGKESWEVDALNPETLVQIVETNILAHVDAKQFNKMISQQDADIKKLNAFIKTQK